MIGLLVSSAWPRYYASSPFNNLLRSNHPRFELWSKLPHELTDPALQERIKLCEALIVDDVLAPHTGFYTTGPKLMIGGDPHAHNMQKVEQLEKEYASVDYVLTGAVFSKKLSPPYHYPKDETRAKHVYWPHSVPNVRPYSMPWPLRDRDALLSGSMDQAVYPYRFACRELSQKGKSIKMVGLGNFQHDAYFELLSKYRSAITCTSNFGYMVAKYLEIPWMSTVLLAPRPDPDEILLMGFENCKNVLWCEKPEEAAAMATQISLDESDLWSNLATEGAMLMEKCHTIDRRLDYAGLLVDRIKQGNFVPEEAKDCFLNHRKESLNAGLARNVAE